MHHNKALLISLSCLFLLQACRSDYKDIDRRQFVVGLGIDKSKSGQFNLTLKGAIPQAQNPGEATSPDSFDIYQTSATSIGQAVYQIKQQFFLEPDYNHLKVIIFSEEFARQEDIMEYINYFIRRRDFQGVAWFAIAPNAKEILSLHQKGERTAGDNLFMKFGEGVSPLFTPIVKIQELYKHDLTPSLTLYSPILKVEDNKLIAGETAIFDEDNHLKLKLNPEETKNFNLMKKGIIRDFISLGQEQNYGIGIKNGKTAFKFKQQEDTLVCDVLVKIDAVIDDVDHVDYTSKEFSDMAIKKLNKELTELLLKLQKNQVDPLFLGLKYWSTYRKFSLKEDWLSNQYPKIKFQVHSDIRITRTGKLGWE